MKRVNEMLATTVLALAMLSGCEDETLAFGEPRCRGVSCAPHGLEDDVVGGFTTGEGKYTRREEVVEAATMPNPCPIEGRCLFAAAPALRFVTRAGETSLLAAGPFWGFHGEPEEIWPEGTGVWVGRYQAGAWQRSSFIRTEGAITNPREAHVAIATDHEVEGEALIAVSEVEHALSEAERRLRVFRLDEDDELQLLFEDEHAASLSDAVMIDRDLLVGGRVQGNFELTRYGLDGKIKWRQTEIRLSTLSLEPSASDVMHIGVFGLDRIAVLSSGSDGRFELLVLDGSGEKLWSYLLVFSSDLGARMAVDSSGALVTVMGGYVVERIEIGDGAERWLATGRAPNEYFKLEIGGFDVGPSGWAYYGTVDGDLNAPVELIERLAPDGSVIDAIPVSTGAWPGSTLAELVGEDEGCGGLLGGGGTLRVDPSEQRAFIATRQCIGEIPLPPLPE